MSPMPHNRPPARPDGALSLAGGAWVHPSSITWSFSGSSGPGGQHVNKTQTRATLVVAVMDIGGLGGRAHDRLRDLAHAHLCADDTLHLHSDENRSQKRNKDACLERLTDLVLQAARPPRPRRKTKRTRSSVERRLEAKHHQGELKVRRRKPAD